MKDKSVKRCRVCGCSDDRACPGGCYWIDYEETICSCCVEDEIFVGETEHLKLHKFKVIGEGKPRVDVFDKSGQYFGKIVWNTAHRMYAYHPKASKVLDGPSLLEINDVFQDLRLGGQPEPKASWRPHVEELI